MGNIIVKAFLAVVLIVAGGTLGKKVVKANKK